MSIPINHHYISRCHLNMFFNESERKIYCYDKQLDNFYCKPTTKSVFSEEYSNTRTSPFGLDHGTLEEQLKKHFEDDFVKHTRAIVTFAESPKSENVAVIESLYHISAYALVLEARFPRNKLQMDNGLDNLMLEVAKKARWAGDERAAAAIERQIADKKTKYSNALNYSTLAARLLERTGDLDFEIFRISSSDVFILPDVGCMRFRARINNYINPNIQEVACIGIPLTPKIYLLASSRKLGNTQNGVLTIHGEDSPTVANLNESFYHLASKTIVASNQQQLEKAVRRSRQNS